MTGNKLIHEAWYCKNVPWRTQAHYQYRYSMIQHLNRYFSNTHTKLHTKPNATH